MGDIFDDLEQQYQSGSGAASSAAAAPAPAPAAVDAIVKAPAYPAPDGPTDLTIGNGPDPFDQLEAQYQQGLHGNSGYYGAPGEAVADELGKGMAFGYFDELQGLDKASRMAIADLFGRGNGKTFDQNYADTVAAIRGRDAQFEKQHPYASFGLNIAGAALPAAVSGGASLLAGEAPVAAASATARAAQGASRLLYGKGLTAAPSVVQLMKMGAAGGALAGSGEANGGNRLLGALEGGATGAVAAPIVGKSLEHSFRGIFDLLSTRGIIGPMAPERVGAESGHIGDRVTGGNMLSPEEIELAKQLKNVPLHKVVNAANELEDTTSTGIPLFLPEAVDSAKVDRNARFIANNEHSMDFANDAIGARTKGAPVRATQLFDTVSPQQDTYEGADAMANAASSIIAAAEQERQKAVAPLYAAAYDERPVIVGAGSGPYGTVEHTGLTDLLTKDKYLQSAIKEVRKAARNAGLPDNSTRLLVMARSELGNQIDRAEAQGMGREFADLTDTYNRLNDILHESPALKAADAEYGAQSQKLDVLNDTYLTSLRNATEDKAENIGRVMDLPAKRIAGLRETFRQAGKLDEWHAGIRAWLQTVVQQTKDGSNFAAKLIDNDLDRTKLHAALGDSYESVLKGLSLEDRMFRGKNKYNAGSSTKGNQDEEKAFDAATGFLAKLKNRDLMGALGYLFNGDMPEEVAQGLARIYFDPQGGKDALNRVIPLLEQYAKGRAAGARIAQVSGPSASEAVVERGEQLLQRARPSHMQMTGTPRAQSSAAVPPRASAPGSYQRPPSQAEPGARSAQITQTQSGPGVPAGSPSAPEESTRPQSTTREAQSPQDRSAQGSESSFKRTADREASLSPLDELAGSLFTNRAREVEQQIDRNPYYSALYEAESSRNPNARNTDSSAAGGFQLIKSTAEALGVKDPTDLAQSFDAVQRLTDQNRQQFGDDPARLYAAHYLGAPLLKKLLAGDELSKKEATQVQFLQEKALPRFLSILQSKVSQEKQT